MEIKEIKDNILGNKYYFEKTSELQSDLESLIETYFIRYGYKVPNFRNPLENNDILSPEIIKAIDEILKIKKDIIFGGSIAFNALSLINRKISDIDIFIEENDYNSIISNFVIPQSTDNQFSETVTDLNGVEIRRIGGTMFGVKICCFIVTKKELEGGTDFTFFGRTIKLQNLNYAIQAKRQYALKTEKHKKDLVEIDMNLNFK